jgi:pyocin large subunit-like protein
MVAAFGGFSRLAAVAGVLALLSACDNGPSAVADREKTAPATAPDAEVAQTQGEAPVPEVDGKPMWSESRRGSAEENAKRAFERNGEAFGARNLDDFVRKAHAFVDHPPAGTAKLVRANGDVLLYDPKSNVFAVANKLGAPRTMFKPDEGKKYWDEQQAREAERQNAKKTSDRKDEGAG